MISQTLLMCLLRPQNLTACCETACCGRFILKVGLKEPFKVQLLIYKIPQKAIGIFAKYQYPTKYIYDLYTVMNTVLFLN